MNYLEHLTIKPVHHCLHNCPYCISRRLLLKQSQNNRLKIEDWSAVFYEANAVGVNYLDISGGEPVLYEDLPALIWEGKRYGWFVSVNSTGWKITEVIDDLLSACLDQVVISLISMRADLHDRLRKTPGSWAMMHEALECLKHKSIRVILHFIINKYNYREIPELIDFAFRYEVNGVAFVYPEDDAKHNYLLMNEDNIDHFRTKTLPECIKRYSAYRPIFDQSHENLGKLFINHEKDSNFAKGQYWKDIDIAHKQCNQPDRFALIYPNGNVLPCNGVEYTHSPIMGNVLKQRFEKIINNNAFKDFRNKKMNFCKLCPIKFHTGIAIRSSDNPPYASPVVRKIPDLLPKIRPGKLILPKTRTNN